MPSFERASNCSEISGEASKRAGCALTVVSVTALSSDQMIELGVRKSVKEKETVESPIGIFAPSFKAIATNLLISTLLGLNRLAKSVLQTFKATARIKKLWRKKLSAKQKPAAAKPASSPDSD